MDKLHCFIFALIFFALSFAIGVTICNADEPDFIDNTGEWLSTPEPPLEKSWWNRWIMPEIPYDTTEKVLLGTLVATNATDALTTMEALDRGAVELNPFLGSHPSNGKLIAVKIAGVTAMTIIANKMDHTFRKILLGTASLLFGGVSLHNMNVLNNM